MRLGPTAAPVVELDDRAPIGRRVQGRYRIIGKLGAGAFGAVCAAEDAATGHRVAIRLLPRGLARAPQVARTIVRLGQSIVEASTSHPGLVRVLAFGQTEHGRPFVAMERVKGRRLSEILSEGKPLAVRAALRLALDLGGSVETLHSMGLVHGALRPCNVMVLEDGRVKLMDVELACLRDSESMKAVVAAEPPAEYLAPEQIRQAPVTDKADVYAFAAILYEMLCGVPPFRAATREAILQKHLTEAPVPMRRRRAVPVSVESAVALALDKQPEVRPFMPDLLNHLWSEAHRPAPRWKRTAVIVCGAAVAVSVALLMVWGPLVLRSRASRPLEQSTQPPAIAKAPASEASPSSATNGSAAARPSRDPAFAVQVGAFGARERAVALQRELARTGAEASVLPAEVGGRTIHRVRVGRFASHAAAADAARRLATSGYATLVVRE